MTSTPPPVKRFNWKNLGLRAATAAVLIPAVVAVVWVGGPLFFLLVALAVALLAYEWGAMCAPRTPIRVAAGVGAPVLLAVLVADSGHYRWAWVVMALGAAICALVAKGRLERRADAAYGVIYIAPACVALIWLRDSSHTPFWPLLAFAVSWAADSAAFGVGSWLKGPKLWPRFSPNKTWSGFFGGLAAAAAAGVALALIFRELLGQDMIALWFAALVGLLGGLGTMAGDLWESAIKRRFGVKDSGDLIPGHGGLLDRVDGFLFCIIVIAAARLVQMWGWVI
jgi:phosphatidate cytidylyltransferase